jgi:hypothetical protein
VLAMLCIAYSANPLLAQIVLSEDELVDYVDSQGEAETSESPERRKATASELQQIDISAGIAALRGANGANGADRSFERRQEQQRLQAQREDAARTYRRQQQLRGLAATAQALERGRSQQSAPGAVRPRLRYNRNRSDGDLTRNADGTARYGSNSPTAGSASGLTVRTSPSVSQERRREYEASVEASRQADLERQAASDARMAEYRARRNAERQAAAERTRATREACEAAKAENPHTSCVLPD